MKDRLSHAAVVFAFLSATALTTYGHNLDTRATSISFDQDFIQEMSIRAAANEQLVRVGDSFWVVIKTTPGPGTPTGVGGYQTFYVPPGMQVVDAAYVRPVATTVDPLGFVPVPMKGQSPIAIGDGPIGAKTATGLTGYTYPVANILGIKENPVTAGGLARGTISGVYADTGIFFSNDSRTGFNTYNAPNQPPMINNSGDTVGEYDAANVTDPGILGVMTQWDSYQLRAFGRKDVIAIIDNVDQRGNAPWGMASAVAGPQSGYRWSFNGTYYDAHPSDPDRISNSIETGPWQRIKYPGSQISKDQAGLISTVIGYTGVDAGDYGIDPIDVPTNANAVRFAIGQLEIGRSEFSAVKVLVTSLPVANCSPIYGDAFGGDAGGTSNGKDHIWRYFDPTVVSLDPCAMLQKVTSDPHIAPNGTTSFKITFANNGTLALPNVVLKDTLPVGLTYLGAVAAPNTVSGSTLYWNVGTVQPKQVINITLNVKATATGNLLNKVEAFSNGTLKSTAYDSVDVGVYSLLREVKSVTPENASPGGTVTYTITVFNDGPGPNGTPLLVTDVLPAGFTYSSFVSATVNGASVSPTINTSNTSQPAFTLSQAIQPDKTAVIKFVATVGPNVSPGTYYNGVDLAFEGKKIGPHPEAPVVVGGGGGVIGDTIFRDWNGNGVQDAGEYGMSGVTVTLSGAASAIAVTDANGNYLFTGLAAGTYTVTVPTPGNLGVPSGYTVTSVPPGVAGSSTSTSITLNAQQQVLTADWGYKPGGSGTIGDQVFEDLSRNGTWESGEPNIPNVTVWLYADSNGDGSKDAADLLVATTATGAGGTYSFTGLDTTRNYFVVVDQSDVDISAFFNTKYGNSSNLFTSTSPLTVNSGFTTVASADFGFWSSRPASIGDQVYYDVNNNGTYESGTDTPLPNATVWLYDSAGTTLLATTTTNALGTYSFTGLAPGTYQVKVNPTTNIPANLTPRSASSSASNYTQGPPPAYTSVVLTSGQNDTTRDFPFVVVAAPLIKAVNLASAASGSNLTYTLTPTYTGTNLLTNVQVIDDVPTGTTYVNPSASPTPFSQPANGGTGSVTWDLGSTTAKSDGTKTMTLNSNAVISLVSGSASSPTGVDGTSLSLTRPTNLAVDDVMIVTLVSANSAATFTAPASWVSIQKTVNGSTMVMETFRKTAVAADVGPSPTPPTSYVFTFSSGKTAGGICAYRNVDTSTPINQFGSNNATSASTTVTAPTITPPSGDTMLVGFFAAKEGDQVFSGGTMTTKLYTGFSNRTGGNDVSLESWQELRGLAANSATGQRQMTINTSAINTGRLIALKPKSATSYSYDTTTALSANRSMVKTGDSITLTLTVTVANPTGSPFPILVTPPVLGTVTGTKGSSVVFGTASPANQTLSSSGSASFTYTSTSVTAGSLPGLLTFAATPSDNKGGTWNPGTANTTIATPVFTYQAKINSSGTTVVNNTAQITSTGGITTGYSNQVTTLVDASIGDFVWADANGDGLQTDETGIPNVTVKLYSDADNNGLINGADAVIATTLTDSTGHYRFYNVTAGAGANYTVTYDFSTVPVGYTPTTATVHDVGTLAVGDQYSIADFGLRPPAGSTGSIGDYIWLDANNDGLQAGESGIANVTVKLYRDVDGNGSYDAAIDVLVGTTTTNASGIYGFIGLPVGYDVGSAIKYLVQVDTGTLPSNTASTTGTVNPKAVSLYSGADTVTNADFGYNYTGSIGDYVWWDDNRDKVQDEAADRKIVGAVVLLYVDANNNGILDVVNGDYAYRSAMTDADGKYLFSNLPAGNYLVDVYEDSITINSLPADPVPTTANVIAKTVGGINPLNYTDADFGYYQGAIVEGVVFWDKNRNTVPETGEDRLSPVTVTLTYYGADGVLGGGDDVVTTTTTGTNGQFKCIVPEGNYAVTYDRADTDIPAALSDATTATSYIFHAAPGEDNASFFYFGVDNKGKIGDTIFSDLGTPGGVGGQPGAGDTGMGGVTVNLYMDTNGNGTIDADGADNILGTADDEPLLDVQVTSGTGFYQFVGLADTSAAQKYVVQVNTLTLPGTYQTLPISYPSGAVTATSTYSTTLSGAADISTVDFGYPLKTGPTYYTVSGTVWDDNGLSTPTSGGVAADGVKNGSEPGMNNVAVTISVDGALHTVYTDSSGAYSLGGVPGAAVIIITVDKTTLPDPNKTAYQQTKDPDDDMDSSTSFTMGGQHASNKDFGYDKDFGSIAGTVVLGSNGNGLADAGELPLSGVLISLRYAGLDGILDTADDVTATTTTDGTGNYAFNAATITGGTLDNGLLPGLYRITETDPSGYVSLADADGSDPNVITIILTVGQNESDQDFEDALANAVIGDRIWLDEDGDGVQDAGEAGIANVRVELDGAGPNGILGDEDDVFLSATITDSEGGYLFTGLLPNTSYLVKVVSATLPTGMAPNPTYDLNGTATPHETWANTGDGEGNFEADFGYNWAPSTDVSGGTNSGTIGDRIWVDANGNGRQDPGEPGLGGVSVVLMTAGVDGEFNTVDDVTAASTSTAAAGTYIFDGLAAGAYVVRVNGGTPPSGYSQTGDPDHFGTSGGVNDNRTTTPIVLGPGDVFVNADFGYQPGTAYSIGDRVFFDANGDGVYDADGADDNAATTADNEYGIPGVSVALYQDADNSGSLSTGDTIIATDLTDASGQYLFPGLANGKYLVAVTDTANLLAGLTHTSGTAATNNHSQVLPYPVTLASAAVAYADFGYTQADNTPAISGTGVIGDTIYLDRSGSGGQDLDGADNTLGTADDEPGLQGVVVQLWDALGTTLWVTTVTDANGNYGFAGLDATATYTVKVLTSTLPGGGAGMTNTGDPDGNTASESLVDLATAGPINLAQDFGYQTSTPNTISGTLWNDLNGDGTLIRETGRYAGVTLDLRDSAGNIVGTATTDAGGNYSFPGLPAGTYTVDVTDTANVLNGLWKSNGANPGADNNSQLDPYSVTVTGGATNSTADFGYHGTPAALGNFVWNDLNGNGIQNSGEPGLAGVTVQLIITWPNAAQTVVRTRTDTSGYYAFGNLLLDETYDGEGSPEPTYSLSIPILPGTASPQNATVEAWDSDNPAGQAAAVSRGALNDNYDFGFWNVGSATISGWVYDDGGPNVTSAGNTINGDDTPQAGVVIRLYLDLNGDGVAQAAEGVATTVTNELGAYSFPNLVGGKYLVIETDPVGASSEYDTQNLPTDNKIAVTLSSGVSSSNNNFLDDGASVASISGWVYDDAGSSSGAVGDGTFAGSPADTLISDVVVQLYLDVNHDGIADPDERVSTTSTVAGAYSFPNLPNGSYLVVQTDASGYTSVLDTDNANPTGTATDNKIAVVLAGSASGNNNFLDDLAFAVSGTVYNDTITNSAIDVPGDTPLSGVMVKLYADIDNGGAVDGGDRLLATQITNGSGNYSFPDIPNGNYLVVETDPSLYASVTDSGEPDLANDNNTIDVTVNNANRPGNNFLDLLGTNTCTNTWADWKDDHSGAEADGNLDADAYDNLADYAFAMPTDSGAGNAWLIQPSATNPGTLEGVYVRPKGSALNVTYTLQKAVTLGDPTVWENVVIPSNMITVVDIGTCLERVTFHDLETLTGGSPFVRIKAELDEAPPSGTDYTTYTEVEGWKETLLELCCRTYNNPFLRETAFTGTVGSVSGQVLTLSTSLGTLSLSSSPPSYPYYLEVTSGDNEGQRFDVASASGTAVTLATDSDLCAGTPPFNTLTTVPASLAGDTVVIRPHWTLGELFPVGGFYANATAALADQVQTYTPGDAPPWTTYYLHPDGATERWVKLVTPSDTSDQGSSVLPPGQGLFINKRSFATAAATSILAYGEVRANDFKRPLCATNNLVGGGYPLDQSANGPAGRAMNKAFAGFFGSRDFKTADSIFVWKGDVVPNINGYDSYFLLDNAPTLPAVLKWVKVGDANLAAEDETLLMLSDRSVFIRVKTARSAYTMPCPWTP
jgi:uncharacterized repeat protein (TIGR01451 family)